MMRRPRRASWWSVLRLVVREQRPGVHWVDYLLVRSADWWRPATVRACLLPWRAAAQRSAAVAASVHTANARRAAEPSEPTPQNPFARHGPGASTRRGGRFSGSRRSWVSGARPQHLTRKAILRGNGFRETGEYTDPRALHVLVKRRCTLTRSQKRGLTRI